MRRIMISCEIKDESLRVRLVGGRMRGGNRSLMSQRQDPVLLRGPSRPRRGSGRAANNDVRGLRADRINGWNVRIVP